MAKEQNDEYIVENEDTTGAVKIADEVVAIIAGLAATEVKGVTSMAGNITNDLVARLGMKSLSKGVRIDVSGSEVRISLTVCIAYGYSIPEISRAVQEKVKSAIENMTGLTVSKVDIRVADVNLENDK